MTFAAASTPRQAFLTDAGSFDRAIFLRLEHPASAAPVNWIAGLAVETLANHPNR